MSHDSNHSENEMSNDTSDDNPKITQVQSLAEQMDSSKESNSSKEEMTNSHLQMAEQNPAKTNGLMQRSETPSVSPSYQRQSLAYNDLAQSASGSEGSGETSSVDKTDSRPKTPEPDSQDHPPSRLTSVAKQFQDMTKFPTPTIPKGENPSTVLPPSASPEEKQSMETQSRTKDTFSSIANDQGVLSEAPERSSQDHGARIGTPSTQDHAMVRSIPHPQKSQSGHDSFPFNDSTPYHSGFHSDHDYPRYAFGSSHFHGSNLSPRIVDQQDSNGITMAAIAFMTACVYIVYNLERLYVAKLNQSQINLEKAIKQFPRDPQEYNARQILTYRSSPEWTIHNTKAQAAMCLSVLFLIFGVRLHRQRRINIQRRHGWEYYFLGSGVFIVCLATVALQVHHLHRPFAYRLKRKILSDPVYRGIAILFSILLMGLIMYKVRLQLDATSHSKRRNRRQDHRRHHHHRHHHRFHSPKLSSTPVTI